MSANILLATLKLFFNFAVNRDYLTDSPITSLKKPYKEKPRQHVINDDDLKLLWEGFENMGYPFGPFYKVLLLTGQRRTETAKMKWSAIDLEARTWTLEASDTKSARRHVCPLSESVVKILDNLPRFHSDYVFTSSWSISCIGGFSQAHIRAKKLAGVDGWTIHDLRRTMRTNLSKIGVQPHIAELTIAHAVGGLQGVYDTYTYHKEKAEALERWAAHLKTIVEGNVGNVVALR